MFLKFIVRVIPWFILWALTLFSADIHIVYKDGAELELIGWASRLANRGNGK